jgi:murein DD-endopeptidase MepM/ murein hydrolase activator NlpD
MFTRPKPKEEGSYPYSARPAILVFATGYDWFPPKFFLGSSFSPIIMSRLVNIAPRKTSHERHLSPNAPPVIVLFLIPLCAACLLTNAAEEGLFRTIDLNVGEKQEVKLSDGSTASVRLLRVAEERDNVRSAVRRAQVRVEINGAITNIISATYHLPVTFNRVQVDCPITKGYYTNRDRWEDSWGLEKDARLRLWPAGSTWTAPGTFVYPIKQRWFASSTQMGNEPAYVDGGETPARKEIYYHSGLDIGGCEGMAEVISASDGLVVSAGGTALPDAEIPFYVRGGKDYVYVLDSKGWFYRYAHLQSIDPAVKAGERIKIGQKIGILGKEGSSGGWSHLHFDIKRKQPSGKWGILEGYALLWEAYQKERAPKVIAVARPHHLVRAGQTATLDGSLSWSAAGQIKNFEWTFGDGSKAKGPKVERNYERAGSYCEILKVIDPQGRIDYDFAVVQVIDSNDTDKLPPTIHAAYAPTFGIHPNDPVTFKVRTFRTQAGKEKWDFGDGTPSVEVMSDGNAKPMAPDGYAETVHRYQKAGDYLVKVERTGHTGATAVTRLHVRVDDIRNSPP